MSPDTPRRRGRALSAPHVTGPKRVTGHLSFALRCVRASVKKGTFLPENSVINDVTGVFSCQHDIIFYDARMYLSPFF